MHPNRSPSETRGEKERRRGGEEEGRRRRREQRGHEQVKRGQCAESVVYPSLILPRDVQSRVIFVFVCIHASCVCVCVCVRVHCAHTYLCILYTVLGAETRY